KAAALEAAFPDGFAYAGDSRADLAVWARATSGVVVASAGMGRRAAAVTEIEQHIEDPSDGVRPWLKALRPHQWFKNIMILVPVVLGWNVVSRIGALSA